ncbi:hypothetical protein GOBAR_DD16789 [Gossypium barbadense]|nr:hypothetical protein GOBAR_DD16789 [Gossypium barbadense]
MFLKSGEGFWLTVAVRFWVVLWRPLWWRGSGYSLKSSCDLYDVSMKFLSWNFRGLGNSAKIRELKQLLAVNNPNIIFLSETKMSATDFRRVQNNCRLQNGLTINSEGRSGGFALMWRDGMNVSIQNYSKHHIDSMVRLENNKIIRVTGFYGHANPNHRRSSWDILRRVGESVKEE